MLLDFVSSAARVIYAIDTALKKENRRLGRIAAAHQWGRALSLGSRAIHWFPDDNHRAGFVAWGRASWLAKDPHDGSSAPSGHVGWAHRLARQLHINLSNEYLTTSTHDECGLFMEPSVLLTEPVGDDRLSSNKPRELKGKKVYLCNTENCPRASRVTERASKSGICFPTLLSPTASDESHETVKVVLSRTKEQKQDLKALPGHTHPTTGARLLLHGLRKCDHCRTPFLHRDINAATSILRGFYVLAALGRFRYGMYKGNVTKGRNMKGRGRPPKPGKKASS